MSRSSCLVPVKGFDIFPSSTLDAWLGMERADRQWGFSCIFATHGNGAEFLGEGKTVAKALAQHQERRRFARPQSESFQVGEMASAIGVHEFPIGFRLAKRTFDVVASIAGILALFPLLLVTAVLVRLSSPGPILFRQERVGLGGRTFSMYKFRTMVVNAETLKSTLMTQNEQSGPVFKMRNDPRITPIGSFLRRYSIDELPQLFNVLRGDMSVVGPRPPIMSEVLKYEKWQLRRLSVKPGLTCIWQTSGRSNVDFANWVRMDLRYIERASFFLDTVLVLKTFRAVFKAEGAY